MNSLYEAVLNAAMDEALKAGASFADGRALSRDSQTVVVKNAALDALAEETETGFGIRVIADDAWGFSSSRLLTEEEARRVARDAVAIARAASRNGGGSVTLAPRPAAVEEWTSPCKTDPFEVPVREKIALLMECDARMAGPSRIAVREGTLCALRTEQLYVSSDGARIHQTKTETGAGLEAVAAQAGEVQVRSYPQYGTDWATAGWEFVIERDLPGHAGRIARQAVELLDAPECPSDVRTLIIRGSMLALQLHESCGHPIELDRVLGTEASFAGTSFLTPDKLGTFRYGSDKVNIVADATAPGGLGTFAYDDEGVAARCEPIVRNGIFVGYLSSRETAPVIGRESIGAMRADGWNRLPIVRMTNVNLLPGDSSLEEMIKGTEKGLLVEGVRSWSIDDKRLNFQFATQYARIIENGELKEVVKNATYTGRTPDFWGGCDAIAGPSEWRLYGIPNCGKGEPMQTAHVGHGVSAARFRNVRVGVKA